MIGQRTIWLYKITFELRDRRSKEEAEIRSEVYTPSEPGQGSLNGEAEIRAKYANLGYDVVFLEAAEVRRATLDLETLFGLSQ